MNNMVVMFKLKIKKIIVVGLAALLVIIGMQPKKVWSSAHELYNKWMVLTMILDKIERFYVDDRNPDDLLKNAIDGMLSGLDPHSVYISKDQYKSFCKNYEGYFGVGLKYSIISGQFVVTSVIENGPAAISDVRVGDRLVKIEGLPVQDIDASTIESYLSGMEDEYVTIEVARPNKPEPITFQLPKRKVFHESVPTALMMDKRTGYVKISNFTNSTPAEFDKACAELNQQGMSRLILDLRNNSGGAFDAGIAVADRFLSAGKIIAFTKGRTQRSSQQYIASAFKTCAQMPLIVLVNEATASDAEIVAGAIQDWDRGLIVGRRTFGKALVQTEFPFQDGSVLLLTTARYYTPLGRLIQSDYYVNPSQSLRDEEYRFKKYKTPKGRIVFGGGGIRPDILLEDESKAIPPVLKKLYLSQEDVFFKFADAYAADLPPEKKPQELKDFLQDFYVTPAMLDGFFAFVKTSTLQLKAEELGRYDDEIARSIKVEIAWRLWGEKGRYAAAAISDAEIIKSLSYFGQASSLLSNP